MTPIHSPPIINLNDPLECCVLDPPSDPWISRGVSNVRCQVSTPVVGQTRPIDDRPLEGPSLRQSYGSVAAIWQMDLMRSVPMCPLEMLPQNMDTIRTVAGPPDNRGGGSQRSRPSFHLSPHTPIRHSDRPLHYSPRWARPLRPFSFVRSRWH